MEADRAEHMYGSYFECVEYDKFFHVCTFLLETHQLPYCFIDLTYGVVNMVLPAEIRNLNKANIK